MMPERNINLTSDDASPGPIRNALCVDTNRVYDSCADKDCLEDLTVVFTADNQTIIDNACSIRARNASILTAFVDVDEMTYNRGCFSVECAYYFLVNLDVYNQNSSVPTAVQGVCAFTKRCILYGSTGSVNVFSSASTPDADGLIPSALTQPVAKVQAVDPIVLASTVTSAVSEECIQIPESVNNAMGGDLVQGEGTKSVLVTLGLFTIVQLERPVQVTVPAYNFNIPEKECSSDNESPCDVFRGIDFPLEEFFPQGSGRCDNCGCERPMDYGGNCN